MDNILYKAFGKRIYKALLNLIGNGGSSNDSANTIIMEPAFDGGPTLFTQERTNIVYTTLTWDEEASQEQIDLAQKMIDNNRKIANSIIQNYNDRKLPNIATNALNEFFITFCTLYQESIELSEDHNAILITIYPNVRFPQEYYIPVTFSDDGKATIRDFNYKIGTK